MTHPPYRVPVVHANDDPDLSDLANVPKAYRHERCGKVTPNDVGITRNIHREPLKLMAGGDAAGCNHCPKDSYPSSEFTWVETGENVRDYYHALIAEEHLARPRAWLRPALREALFIVFVFGVGGFGLGLYLGKKLNLAGDTSLLIVLGSLAFALASAAAVVASHWLRRRNRVRRYLAEFGAPRA